MAINKNKLTNMDIVNEILNKTEEELEKMPPVTILVAGKTGVGKSTLINGLFREKLATTGIGQPVTQHIEKIEKEGVPLTLYDTRGLELNPQVQEEVKDEINAVFDETQGTEQEIYVTYYCINANSNRIEDAEMDLIKSISKKMPVLLVLTQSIGQPAQEFKEYLEQMDLPVADIINVMAQDYQIADDLVIDQFGLKTLIARTLDIIPDEAERAFNNAQHADIERKAKSARRWAKRYITAAFGVGFIPIPFSDASLLVPMQITLIAHITAIFGISLDKTKLISIVAAVFGTTGATQAGRYVASNLLKLIPGAGSLAGGTIGGATASMLTSALAISYIEVLSIITKAEKSGRLDDIPDLEELMKIKMKEQMSRRKNDSDLTELEDEESKEIEMKQPNKKQQSWIDKIKDRFNL
ncbi:MAG: 50S ribosome-binding GTPase [Atopococcus tabaci]|uniref:50S ribosome-binding GTPase n=1 Tax=Atopococcus tabaci TaxID=269774 RepID=A0AA43RJU2_9LACT|nr:50S ribosome-binding GTPase [Atopococcus tabaci]